jgi:hypothetical protein
MEPPRPKIVDEDKVAREAVRKAKADQAASARAARPQNQDGERLAIIREELHAGGTTKNVLARVNKRLPKRISLPTFYRLRGKLAQLAQA